MFCAGGFSQLIDAALVGTRRDPEPPLIKIKFQNLRKPPGIATVFSARPIGGDEHEFQDGCYRPDGLGGHLRARSGRGLGNAERLAASGAAFQHRPGPLGL